ncbi:hypothetical protein [Cellulomonas shaoxiangyii]|uniref:Uncharacterized protein n=1 Tax=Cellulomonas shaoxiangyii TaxID=2566013 RepID=A0A4V1CN10_9CELL|nr:hypothetical protein [Cellulomonas shaoxiangyii]QCB94815.1 hypothetical protein E5225_15845 [Cellulomonas shaoxiangyii]TGY86545.1 hypothetical protein E5226_01870 [Cellulomonas shaoxiangyii]
MIGRGHVRAPREPVDRWLEDAGGATHEKIGPVRAELASEEVDVVLAGLRRAGVDGPADALLGLARRISATPRWSLGPVGTQGRDARGRLVRVAMRTELSVRGRFGRSE